MAAVKECPCFAIPERGSNGQSELCRFCNVFDCSYDPLTGLISALNPLAITLPQKAIFMESIKNTYVALAIVNGIAILPSIFQLSRRRSSLPPANVVTETVEPA
jgi:hypothetical protein